ncbi:MAG: fibronectin type III domain-containing protein [Clostridiales bacterium]|nr:fibronectin type III domain-containing protein [Clostridiales bacterium]
MDAAAAALTAAIDALEAMPEIDYTQYDKGVTVIESAESPTGYLAVFVYEEEDSYSGITGDINKVVLYSDCMMLFDPDDGEVGSISAQYAIDPWNYTAGLANAGGSSDVAYYVTMVEFADGLWGTQIPLASGAYVYNFTVYDTEGNSKSRLDDPNNPTMTNTATGISSLSSMVYVDYNEETMGTSEYADRTIENPRTDGQTGTVVTTSYTGADGTEHGLAIYLPYGYDADQAEAYNVLYLSHGTSGDIYGDELRWMNEGAVANIMDNLIAEGTIEPFVVVTMNNQQYGQGDGHSGANWKYSDIEEDQQLIMEFVEANYNVSTEVSGRAYAGLSMGGSTTSNMLMYHADWFSYYGIWSYANTDGSYGGVDGIDSETIQSYLSDYVGSVNIMLAAGKWDFGNSVVNDFGATLTELGFDYDYLEVPTAHDWEGWQLMFAYAAENFFFQNEEETVDTTELENRIAVANAMTETSYTEDSWAALQTAITESETLIATEGITQAQVDAQLAALNEAIDGLEFSTANATIDFTQYEAGVTVIESEDSPTGFYAVFVFDETSVDATKYGLTNDISLVKVYSDGMYLFSYDEQETGTALDPISNAHTPDEYEIGMYPAGGDTSSDLYGGKKIAYYADMTEFADGMWGAAIPLTSGATYYNYRLTDSTGASDSSYIDDPANPTMTNTESGSSSRSSMVYVGYNAEKMGTGEWSDRTVENPRTDGKTGTVEYATYTGADGTDRYLGIYLPYGYDADAAETYNVLYLSHGAQSEQSGCELRWLNECAAVNIMDNLEGNFIIVTMNNTDLSWDTDKIWAEQELIMAYMEENYNVGTTSASRAFAGLSMGGYTASRIYAYHADQFAYVGIWSYADATVLASLTDDEKAALVASGCKVSIGAGDWDYLLSVTETFASQLDELGIEYQWLTVPGSHDWRTWAAMLTYTVQNFFWQDTVDTSALTAAIEAAEALTETDYKTSTWSVLEDALEAAETVLADADATQEEVDAAAAALTAAIDALEKVPAIDYTQYDKGVTVIESADSPTGYLAVFVYEEEGSYDGITGDITKVELYSDCMMLFDTNDGVSGSISAEYAIDPWNYTAGLASAGGSTSVAYYVTMVEFADGLWGTQVPLASGAYVYNFQVTDSEGNTKSRLDDPNNPTMTNTATGISSLSSMVYVDYNADTMGTGDYADRTVENARTDDQTGTVEFISYDSDQNGSNRGLAVYLPADYDADREEPYNVLYLSHGASGDSVGNELRWMNEGGVANIMDNLIAEGKIDSFIVVTMNNQDLGWDYSKIEYEQYNYIMPIIESTYNVSTEASGRAYAGLSMGGITTSNMLLNHAEDYAYYGIWSASNTSISDEQAATLTSLSDQLNFLMAAGQWDFGLSSVTTFGNALGDLGFTYDTLTVPGAHDWETWQLIYAYAAENFFFQNEEETVDTSTLSAAITQAEGLTESDYTSSTWAALETALENAKTVLADSAATQSEVDEATAALTAAISALEEEEKVTVPSATKITSLTNTAKGVKVVWNKVSNATSYQVYRKVGSGSWKKVKTTSSTSWTDTSAKKNGTKYQYKVYAVNEAGKSKASATETIYRLTAKKFTRAKNVSSKKISLKWTRNTKATGYIIEYSTSSDFSDATTIKVKGNKKVTTTIKNLKKGKTYYLRMRPYKTSGSVTSYAGWSKVKKVKVTK